MDVTDQAMRDYEYLSQKRTNLSAPGTKLNNQYYNSMNSVVSAVECTYSFGRLAIAGTALAFGSNCQYIIPNSSFIGTTVLHVELPNLPSITPAGRGLTLSRGWGFGLIRQITYLFGSSTTSQLAMSGASLFQTIMCECDTAERKAECLRLGGQEHFAPINWVDPADGLIKRDPNARLCADIVIPLPWSNMNGACAKLPFDTNLLSNVITIQIEWENHSSIYGGVQTDPLLPIPTALLAATLLIRQGELRDKSHSLRQELELSRNTDTILFANYPFIHHQSYQPASFAGSANGQPVSIPLQSLINGDLLSVTFGVIRSSLLKGTATQAPNSLAYEDISDVRLLYNGNVVYNAPGGGAYKLANMISGGLGASYIQNSLILPFVDSMVASMDSTPIDTYIIEIDFSRIKSLCYSNFMENVWRLPNNTLTLEFITKGDSTIRYNIFVSYHYNGVQKTGPGGMSETIFA